MKQIIFNLIQTFIVASLSLLQFATAQTHYLFSRFQLFCSAISPFISLPLPLLSPSLLLFAALILQDALSPPLRFHPSHGQRTAKTIKYLKWNNKNSEKNSHKCREKNNSKRYLRCCKEKCGCAFFSAFHDPCKWMNHALPESLATLNIAVRCNAMRTMRFEDYTTFITEM